MEDITKVEFPYRTKETQLGSLWAGEIIEFYMRFKTQLDTLGWDCKCIWQSEDLSQPPKLLTYKPAQHKLVGDDEVVPESTYSYAQFYATRKTIFFFLFKNHWCLAMNDIDEDYVFLWNPQVKLWLEGYQKVIRKEAIPKGGDSHLSLLMAHKDKPKTLYYNSENYQPTDDTLCGQYCLFFLVVLLNSQCFDGCSTHLEIGKKYLTIEKRKNGKRVHYQTEGFFNADLNTTKMIIFSVMWQIGVEFQDEHDPHGLGKFMHDISML